MTGKTHITGGIAASLAFAQITNYEPALLLVGGVAGALIPDICHGSSKIGRALPFLSKIINGIFGLGHMLGISLSGIFLTLAFRYYSGVPGTTPDPGDTTMFVASMNATFLFALAISAVPFATSLKMKKVSQY